MDDQQLERAMDLVLEMAPHLRVAHHVPGRIRFKLLPSGIDIGERLARNGLVAHIPGIESVSARKLSRSLVLEYDPKVLTDELWDALGRVHESPDLEEVVRRRLRGLLSPRSVGRSSRRNSTDLLRRLGGLVDDQRQRRSESDDRQVGQADPGDTEDPPQPGHGERQALEE